MIDTKLLAEELLNSRREQSAVLEYRATELDKNIFSSTEKSSRMETELATMKVASALLQELVDQVSITNIARIEKLVNQALQTIFHDIEGLEFKIISEVKRNLIAYRLVLMKHGVEGGINSFGGGPWSVVAVILKILFCILAKRFPLLVLDESLSFLSEHYIESASSFLKEMSKEFGIPILMVTHQPLFSENSDHIYQAKRVSSNETVFEKLR